jgi:carboxypeptidase family protein
VQRLARVGLVVLLLSTVVFAELFAGKNEPPQPRTISGTVVDHSNQPAGGAIVYLKNMRNLAVSTFIAGNDGAFRFNGLSPDVDYQVYSEYQGHKSGTKTISSFGTRTEVHLNLRLGQ